MYINENSGQMTLKGFYAPFIEKLSPERSRWVKLSEKIPWGRIEVEYLKISTSKNGRPAISSQIAFGACFICSDENMTDERIVQAIAENPCMQYYLWIKEFNPDPLFNHSLMVRFRKRYPVIFYVDVNVCISVLASVRRTTEMSTETTITMIPATTALRQLSRSRTETIYETNNNRGHLIMGATVASANIKYPTDIDLLNKLRELLEKAISIYWEFVLHKGHMFPYNKKNACRSIFEVLKRKK